MPSFLVKKGILTKYILNEIKYIYVYETFAREPFEKCKIF